MGTFDPPPSLVGGAVVRLLNGGKMQRRGYVVEIQNHDIVVRVTGTSYTATYHRLGDSLLARNLPLRDDHRAPMSCSRDRLAEGTMRR